MYTHTYMYVYIYIYAYINIYIYIYIYIHKVVVRFEEGTKIDEAFQISARTLGACVRGLSAKLEACGQSHAAQNEDHRWNRHLRPQPKRYSTLVSLIYFS